MMNEPKITGEGDRVCISKVEGDRLIHEVSFKIGDIPINLTKSHPWDNPREVNYHINRFGDRQIDLDLYDFCLQFAAEAITKIRRGDSSGMALLVGCLSSQIERDADYTAIEIKRKQQDKQTQELLTRALQSGFFEALDEELGE